MAAFAARALLLLLSLHATTDAAFVVQLDPYGDSSIRVRVAPSGASIVQPPAMGLLPEPPLSTSPSSRSRNGYGLTVGNLNVTVDPTTGFVTAVRLSDGAVVLQQTALTFGPTPVNATRAGSMQITVAFRGTPNERLYGFGEHRTGKVAQQPHYHDFAKSQVYGDSHGADASIPFYSSSLGYGFLWNLPAYGYVNASEGGIVWSAIAAHNADFWVTVPEANASHTPFHSVLHHYVDAVGHAPRMPPYSTGFIQCKNRYRNQTQLLDVAHGYVDRGLPISVIVIDWFHWVHQGDWSFNKACWPDPQSMVDELRTLGIELMVTFWPFQTTGSQHWDEFKNGTGYLAHKIDGSLQPFDGSQQYVYSPFNAEARKAVFKGFTEGYGTYGVKTLWLDAAEPERPSESSLYQFRFAGTPGDPTTGGTDSEVGSAWIQQHTLTFAEGMAAQGIAPDEYFVLPRHAWVGSWRHSAALWSGDIPSTFDELTTQVTVAQGVAMSGVVLWTTDIGGYGGGDPSNPEFQELIVRWFQFGAFCPLFRLHGARKGGPPTNECGYTNGDNEVWNLAKDPTHYRGITRVMDLRENLRPYVARINQEAADTGLPMLRPMFLEFPGDTACEGSDVENQFMFGDQWLVRPVTTYQELSATVYLPALDPTKEEWVYFYNETALPSGKRVTIDTSSVEFFPLFYRRPVAASTGNITLLWSASRSDHVSCVTAECMADNAPGVEGNYASQGTDSKAFVADHLEMNGKVFPLSPLQLHYSSVHRDNFVAPASAKAPDSTYSVQFADGFVLPSCPPDIGSSCIPLQVYFKDFGAGNWDHVTVANPATIATLKGSGYALNFTAGYVLA